MPCDFGCFTAVLTKDDPCMILGQSEVDIIETQNLTSSDDAQCDTKTIQLVS